MLKQKNSIIVILTLLLTLALVMLGSYTRLSDSGLGCPDWPGCYGKLSVNSITDKQINNTFPDKPLEVTKAWTEMTHRYLGAIIGFLIFLIAIISIYQRTVTRNYSEVRPLLLPLALLVLVVLQGLLGMWTVTKLVFPAIVTTHLLGGMAIVALLYLLHLKLANPGAKTERFFKTKFGVILVFFQIALGGWVSTNYSALACTSFPGCYSGTFFPSMELLPTFNIQLLDGLNYEGGVLSPDTRATIHMMHRIGALVVTIYLLFLFFSFVDSAHKRLRSAAWFLLFTLIAQVTLGIVNVYLSLPLPLAVLHNGFAAVLLLSAINLWFFSKKPKY